MFVKRGDEEQILKVLSEDEVEKKLKDTKEKKKEDKGINKKELNQDN